MYAREEIRVFEKNIDDSSVNIDIKQIHQHIYNPHRFDEICVLIADYNMPEIDGVTLCKELKDKHIQRILLTAEATLETAVNAFNQHLIHQFILKEEHGLNAKLNGLIEKMQYHYFLNFSHSLINSSIQSLTDPAFIELFNALCKQNNIVEYYLLDNQGSYLLLDASATPFWFIVKDEEEVLSDQEMAEFGDAPSSIISALKARSHFPYLYSDEDLNTPPAQWERFMHPTMCLEGQKRYYYYLLKA